LWARAGKNIEDASGKMAYSAAAGLGETVTVFMVPDSAGMLVPEKKSAVRASDNETRDFYHILALDDQKEYWIQNLFLAPNAKPAVVLSDNAMLYSKPDLAAVARNGVILPKYSVVGLHAENAANASNDFYCVSAYIDTLASPSVVEMYIKADTLTVDSADVRVIQLYQTALASANETVKKEILTNALSLGGAFSSLVSRTLDEMSGKSAFTIVRDAIDAGYIIYSDDGAPVNARDAPGTTGTNVLFALEDRADISISDYTEETDTIGGSTARWYKVADSDGREGWVFGAFIDVR
jgi:hypothetical protein